MVEAVATGTSQPPALARRLRGETSELHDATETAVGIPGSIRDVLAYSSLLITSLDFYQLAQSGFDDPRWARRWTDLGVRIGDHDRTSLLCRDIAELGIGSPKPARSIRYGSFAEALGWLYVVEGSSLGGRFLAPAIVGAIGEVPTAFYRGEGRAHPAPWRSLQAALSAFDEPDADTDEVIAGAVAAFRCFGETVSLDPVVTAR